MSRRDHQDGDDDAPTNAAGDRLRYPSDGYRVNHHFSELKHREELYLELYGDGKLVVEPVLLTFADDGNSEAIAKLRRALPLYRAFCRFINAGGSLGQMAFIREVFAKRYVKLPQLELPPGVKQIDTIEQTVRQDLYQRQDGSVLVVTADEWVEEWPIESLLSRVQGELIPSMLEPNHGDQPLLQREENTHDQEQD